ncbi:MAG TPA: DUF3501 family protein [Gammaproteobacteria bacterium]|nr:DUF3501 family protein [Gammaproteobacteria bacterium]
MSQLQRGDLHSLEKYAEIRPEFRREIMAYKRDRQLPVGPNATLYFEDRRTIQYQVQEILRVERIFDPDEIEDELAAYNPLIPDGHNWKATFMLEYPDAEERRRQLARLVGIENRVWIQIGDHDPVRPVADEDLERSTPEKTSSVHFLRFELTPAMVRDARDGATLRAGIDHDNYRYRVDPVPDNVARALAGDLAAAD